MQLNFTFYREIPKGIFSLMPRALLEMDLASDAFISLMQLNFTYYREIRSEFFSLIVNFPKCNSDLKNSVPYTVDGNRQKKRS
jgi:hypothetical protein